MYKKLLAVQKEIGAISKDSTNPFFHSKYFDINKILEVIKPVLNKHGLVLLQPLTHIDGHSAIKTMLVDAETGETIESITPITENPDPQKMGSGVTYFRRYCIQSFLLLQAEDDDANKASGKDKPKVERATIKFKPETDVMKAKDRIRLGFQILKTADDEEQDLIIKHLGVNTINECDDLVKLNSLLEYLTNKAKGKK